MHILLHKLLGVSILQGEITDLSLQMSMSCLMGRMKEALEGMWSNMANLIPSN